MMDLKPYKVLLASASPRRQQLLKELGINYELAPLRDIDESYPVSLLPDDIAKYLAEKKAGAYSDLLTSNNIIITADTVVIHKKHVLGKPRDKEEAIYMLQKLSGTKHKVITGVSLQWNNQVKLFDDTSAVYFEVLTNDEIQYYVDHCSPYDKAGGYAVQEWIGYIGIRKIKGSYFNIMGLPVHKLYKALKMVQVDIGVRLRHYI